MFSLHVCKHTRHMPGAHRCQKRILDALKLELKMVVSHYPWEPNLGSLQEQLVLLMAEPSLQTISSLVYRYIQNDPVFMVRAFKVCTSSALENQFSTVSRHTLSCPKMSRIFIITSFQKQKIQNHLNIYY